MKHTTRYVSQSLEKTRRMNGPLKKKILAYERDPVLVDLLGGK